MVEKELRTTPDRYRWRRSVKVRAISAVKRGKNIVLGGRGSDGAGDNTNKTAADELGRDPILSVGSSWTDLFTEMGMARIDKEAINYFIKSEKLAKRKPESAHSEPDAVLRRFGMLSPEGKVTLAAVLLFGKPNDTIEGSIVKIGEFSDEGELVREEIIDLPVIMQPDAVTKALFEKYIPDTFEYVDARRNVVNRYPHKAIREAVVNAIAHKKYESREPILIKVSTNNVEMYNPGDLPPKWVAEDLIKKHHSVRRNKGIAKVFHDAGFSESWGKGINMMMEACKENGNPPPEFTVRHGGLEVMFEANNTKRTQTIPSSVPRPPDTPDTPEGVIREPTAAPRPDTSSVRYEVRPRPQRLSDSESAVCKMIAENERITVSEMSTLSGLSERQIYRITKDLSERGTIIRVGSKKRGSWKLNDKII